MEKNKNYEFRKSVVIRKNGSKKIGTVNTFPSKTDQQWKDDCDVNIIMDRFLANKTPITHIASSPGIFQDLTEIPDLQTAYMDIQLAEETFMELPSEIRKEFGNDPRNLYKFAQDPSNKERAIKLGLLGGELPVPPEGKPPGATDKPLAPPQDPSPKSE